MAGISLYENSVAPVKALALDYSKIRVTWFDPNPTTYTALRLVRNQYATSETQEDGEILYEFNNASGSGLSTVTQFTDGVDTSASNIPLIPGQYAYYTVWLLIDNNWIRGGSTSVLLPKQHPIALYDGTVIKSSHDKFMDYIPRVFTSKTNSPFDAVDTDSELYSFLKAFSFTYDEMLTYADLSVRSLSAKYISDKTVPSYLLDLGIRSTSLTPTAQKKALISKATDLLATKGMLNTLYTFVESFTGFNTIITDSSKEVNALGTSNLLLNCQDGSFIKGGLGGWQGVSNITSYGVEENVAGDTIGLPSDAGSYSVANNYRLKVTFGPSGVMQLGFNGIIDGTFIPNEVEALRYGIPVTPQQQYTFSFWARSNSGTISIIPTINWFDQWGKYLGTSSVSKSIGTTWSRQSYTGTAPGWQIASTRYTVGTSNTVITLPVGHGLTTSSFVWFEDEYLPFTGKFAVTAATSTSITIGFSRSAITLNSVSSSGTTFTLGTGSTASLFIGQTLTVTSGTGTLNGTTKVTEILSSTQFKVDTTPSVALSGATVSAGEFSVDDNFVVFAADSSSNTKLPSAKFAILRLVNASNSSSAVAYFDNFQLNPGGSATQYIEPRCIDIQLEPSKINYIIDPSFVNTGWSSPNGGTYTKTDLSDLTGLPYTSGITMGKVQTINGASSAANPDIKTAAATPVETNNSFYTFSVYIKGSAAYKLKLGLTDGTVNGTMEKEIDVNTSWQRVSVTVYTSSSSSGLTPYIYRLDNTSRIFYLDNAQLEEGSKASDYFSGDFDTLGAFWSGTANASKSYLYVNKSTKVSELSAHLSDWIPINFAWMIRSRAGVELVGSPIESPLSNIGGGGGGFGSVVAI